MTTYPLLTDFLKKSKKISQSKDFLGRPIDSPEYKITTAERQGAYHDLAKMMSRVTGTETTETTVDFVLNGTPVKVSAFVMQYATNRPVCFMIDDKDNNSKHTNYYGVASSLEKALTKLLEDFTVLIETEKIKRNKAEALADDQDSTVTLKLNSSPHTVTLTHYQLIDFAKRNHLSVETILTKLTPEIMAKLTGR